MDRHGKIPLSDYRERRSQVALDTYAELRSSHRSVQSVSNQRLTDSEGRISSLPLSNQTRDRRMHRKRLVGQQKLRSLRTCRAVEPGDGVGIEVESGRGAQTKLGTTTKRDVRKSARGKGDF